MTMSEEKIHVANRPPSEGGGAPPSERGTGVSPVSFAGNTGGTPVLRKEAARGLAAAIGEASKNWPSMRLGLSGLAMNLLLMPTSGSIRFRAETS